VKDHVTLKTGVMMINSAEQLFLIVIIFHCFYCIFDQINALLSRKKSVTLYFKVSFYSVIVYLSTE